MTRQKLVNLNKYLIDLKNRLEAPTPSKHEGHPESYKQYLKREIQTVESTLEQAKLEAMSK